MGQKSLIVRTVAVDEVEAKKLILDAIRKAKGSVMGASRLLRVTRATLWRYLIRLGLEGELEAVRQQTTWRRPELRTFARGGRGDGHGHFKRFVQQRNKAVRAKQTVTMAKKLKENGDFAPGQEGIEKSLDERAGEG